MSSLGHAWERVENGTWGRVAGRGPGAPRSSARCPRSPSFKLVFRAAQERAQGRDSREPPPMLSFCVPSQRERRRRQTHSARGSCMSSFGLPSQAHTGWGGMVTCREGDMGACRGGTAIICILARCPRSPPFQLVALSASRLELRKRGREGGTRAGIAMLSFCVPSHCSQRVHVYIYAVTAGFSEARQMPVTQPLTAMNEMHGGNARR